MSSTSHALEPRLADYLRTLSVRREDPLLAELRAVTAELPQAEMQISVEQGVFMSFLVRSLGARRCLEVGVFTGYSSLCVARALPSDGKLLACDLSAEWTAIARRFWERAGLAAKIELRLGPGAETLAALIAAGERGRFDFAFLDADKSGQAGYYEQCLALLRPGGVLAIDNAFMGGDVVDAQEGSAAHVRALTERIFADARVEPTLVPIGDGLLLAQKCGG
ncbi:MAG: SAM-dependent methyltransferase [Planctomycetes bacterium]|nr:SAM-dependent methyltransferase [Planctomycetota bacterium]